MKKQESAGAAVQARATTGAAGQANAAQAAQVQAQRNYYADLSQPGSAQASAGAPGGPTATQARTDGGRSGAGRTHAAPKKPAKVGSLEAVGRFFNSLEVKRGQFADVDLSVELPLPQLPGTKVKLALKGTYCCDAKGGKELSVAVDGGLAWELFDWLKASVRVQTALKLSGDDLGAAFLDSMKQIFLLQMQACGIDDQIDDLARLAKEGAGFWRRARALIPIYGTWDAAKIVIAKAGEKRIFAMHRAYHAFFKNDPSVGFEASVAVIGEAGADRGDRGVKGQLEARTGLEDRDQKDVRAFGELAGEVAVNDGNNQVKIRVAKRWRQGGPSQFSLEVNGQYSSAKAIAAGAGTRLSTARAVFQALKNLKRSIDGARDGQKLTEVSGVANGFIAAFAAEGKHSRHVDGLTGLDLSATWQGGNLSTLTARLKNLTQIGTGTNNSVGAVEANVQIGSFTDVSKQFKATWTGVS